MKIVPPHYFAYFRHGESGYFSSLCHEVIKLNHIQLLQTPDSSVKEQLAKKANGSANETSV